MFGDRYVVLADCNALPTVVGKDTGAYSLDANVKVEFWNEGWQENSGNKPEFCKVCGCVCLCACIHRSRLRVRARAHTHTHTNVYTPEYIYT